MIVEMKQKTYLNNRSVNFLTSCWERPKSKQLDLYSPSYLISSSVFQAWESDEAIEEDMPESPGAEKLDKDKAQSLSKKDKGQSKS